MGSLNRVMLIGHLGRDGELKYTQAGAAVMTLSLATTDTWKDKSGEKKEQTTWHRVVVWGQTAEALAKYLTKGRLVYVEGSLQTREWEDKNQQKRYTTEVKARSVQLLGGGNSSGREREREADSGHERSRVPDEDMAVDDESIPF